VATLFGRQWTRQELLTHVGDISQLGGIRLVTLADGPERGVRAADVRTGDGFNFTVLLDRGMDIGHAEYRGTPLAWVSPTGPVAPAAYEPHGIGWLRTFHGGLLTTCGLTQVGVPNVDSGEELGLHGRISHIPARHVGYQGGWEGDEYTFWVEGEMREVSVFGHDLRLTRRITARLGQPTLTIEDKVENMGYESAPHMILYHCNLGFPLLSPASRLVAPSVEVEPRDEIAAPGLTQHTSFESPTPHYAEQCFFHRMEPDQAGLVTVRLANPDLRLIFQLRFRQCESPGFSQLPEFVQWKQVGQGTYVLGLEPANCRGEGRSAARERGTLVELAPGEARSYFLEMTVLGGKPAGSSETQEAA
jgi:hypothetical protein